MSCGQAHNERPKMKLPTPTAGMRHAMRPKLEGLQDMSWQPDIYHNIINTII